MTSKDLRSLVWETHQHMPRLLKAILATRLLDSFELVQEASTLLGLMDPPMFDVAASTIDGDELVLASTKGPFARVYIGDNPKLFKRVTFTDGTTVTGHEMAQLRGEELHGAGYYDSCQCNLCFAARLLKASRAERPHLTRNSTRVLTVPSISQHKIRSHTERVANVLQSADIRPDSTMINIIGYYNQNDNEYREIPTTD